MYGGEVGDEGEECLEDLKLYVDALRHAVVHRLDDSRDRGEGDGAQGNEALECTKGDRDHLGIFRCTTHKYGAEKVFCVPTICCRRGEKQKVSPGFTARPFGQEHVTPE